MKKHLLLLSLLLLCLPTHAQRFTQVQEKAFNFGVKAGVNTIFPIVNSLTIDGVEVQDIRLQYEVGYHTALFCKINFDRFFVQPDISWGRTEGYLLLPIPANTEMKGATENPTSRVQMKTTSLEMPVLIGYHLVKERPYALSLTVGPNIKYNYRMDYIAHGANRTNAYVNDDNPFGLGFTTGLGISIGRLLFEYSYEFGLNRTEADFKEKSSFTPAARSISIDKRTNSMRFSVGLLF